VALPTAFLVGRLAHLITDSLLPGDSSSGVVSWCQFAGVASVIIALGAATSYAMFTHGDQDIRWSEEVALPDGTTLVVSRRVVGNSFGRPKVHPDSWLPSSFEVDVSAVPSLAGAATWRSSMRPVLLEKTASNATWILLAEPKNCGEWYELNKPNPPYLAYELRRNTWARVEVPRELLGHPANLVVAPRFTGEPRIVSAAEVLRRNTEGRPRREWPVIKEAPSNYC